MTITTNERQGTIIPGAITDGDGRLIVVGADGLPIGEDMPPGATTMDASSGNVANASAVATLPSAVGKTNYITGFEVTASGATAGLAVDVTITGLQNTLHYTYVFPAGVAVQAEPLVIEFARPRKASAPNTAIVVTLPAGGAGNTNAAVNAHGYQV